MQWPCNNVSCTCAKQIVLPRYGVKQMYSEILQPRSALCNLQKECTHATMELAYTRQSITLLPTCAQHPTMPVTYSLVPSRSLPLWHIRRQRWCEDLTCLMVFRSDSTHVREVYSAEIGMNCEKHSLHGSNRVRMCTLCTIFFSDLCMGEEMHNQLWPVVAMMRI